MAQIAGFGARVFVGVLAVGLVSGRESLAADAARISAAFDSIRTDDLRSHVNVLASDTFEGREAGSRGGRATGVYIGKELRQLGILVGASNQSYYQDFGYDYRNVLGLLPGSDPQLKHEIIVIGAHYDHVGYGTKRNSRGPIGQIHNGADDNASGVSGLLEVTEALSALDPRPKRSILIAFWDAEEKGLLGSKHWIANPTVSLNQVRLSVNADMIGRLRDGNLEVAGTRTARGLRRFVSSQMQGLSLKSQFTWEVRSDSDHYPFYTRGIPILMLHSGKHDDYHRPSDDVDKVNFQGMQQVARLAFRLVLEAAEKAVLPAFRELAYKETKTDQLQVESSLAATPPRLGVRWDERLAETGIVKLAAVARGSAAQRAGLEVGDRIVKFAGHPTNQWKDFRTLVVTAGKRARMLVERDGLEAPLDLNVALDGTPTKVGIAWRVDDAEPGCVILRRVIPGSPAGIAALRISDRVYAINGISVTNSEHFYRMIVESDRRLVLVVERQGEVQTVPIKLVGEPNSKTDGD